MTLASPCRNRQQRFAAHRRTAICRHYQRYGAISTILLSLVALAGCVGAAADGGPGTITNQPSKTASTARSSGRRSHAAPDIAAAPPSATVPGLDPSLPAESQYALRRLNEYRAAAGLSPYRYAPELTRMAQAHADYVALNCQKADDNAARGHFERNDFPGYTSIGDEAAETSGISYDRGDAFEALESLYEGPFHRLQFLRPKDRRVGVGFARNESRGCGAALFVTRPAEDPTAAADSPPRGILLDPPPGARDVRTGFDGEHPDPRPLRSTEETGFPIVIRFLDPKEARRVLEVKAQLRDEFETALPIWISHPGRPSVIKAPDIYRPGTVPPNFADNFDSIFIMPQNRLAAGVEYTVRVSIDLDGARKDLELSFRTRDRKSWTVRDTSRTWDTFDFASRHAEPGIVYASVAEPSRSLATAGSVQISRSRAQGRIRRR